MAIDQDITALVERLRKRGEGRDPAYSQIVSVYDGDMMIAAADALTAAQARIKELEDGILSYAKTIERIEQEDDTRLAEVEKERDAARELLGIWSHDGALQTFEDRERFRAAVRALSDHQTEGA